MNKSTLLLVDDEPNVCRALQRLLNSPERIILTADSGESALRILEDQDVDIVVSDMQMPGIDGAELLSRIKQSHTRRVVLTGYADSERAMAAINKGAVNRYLTKPWQNSELLAVITDEEAKAMSDRQSQNAFKDLTHHVSQLQNRVEMSASLLSLSTSALQDRQYDSVAQFGHILFRIHCPLKSSLSKAVTTRVADTAKRLGIPAEKISLLTTAALLHRLGELAMPTELVSTPFLLMTSNDVQAYALYPAYSASLVASDNHELARLVRQHRCRLQPNHDQSPDNLAQLLELVTEFEELCLFNGVKDTITYVKQERGRRYTAEYVDALLKSVSG